MRYDIHTVSKIITEDPNLINQDALNEATLGQNFALGAGLLGGMLGIGGQTANAQTPTNQPSQTRLAKTKEDISWVKPQHIQKLVSDGGLRKSVGDELEAILIMYKANQGDERGQAKALNNFLNTFGREHNRIQDDIQSTMKAKGYNHVSGTKPRIDRSEALYHYDQICVLADFAKLIGALNSNTRKMTQDSFRQILGLE